MSIHNFEKLINFCNKNNIELLNDYCKQKITSRTQIEGKCILYDKCKNLFTPFYISNADFNIKKK